MYVYSLAIISETKKSVNKMCKKTSAISTTGTRTYKTFSSIRDKADVIYRRLLEREIRLKMGKIITILLFKKKIQCEVKNNPS